MQVHYDLIQGSPEWLAYRLEHDNASEAAAILGLSKTTTRSELLHAKHTGLGREFSDWVQRNVLDYGHEVEALVRPLVEAMIGESLYTMTCSDGRLSASLDGINMGEDITFECKQWNDRIAALVAAGEMPEEHMPQCQQILMVTKSGKLIFAVGDGTPENLLTLEVFPDPAWFERIRAGWKQFHEDLAAYTPPAVVVEAVGRTPETLPALRIEVTGMVTASNIAEFKATALGAIKSVNRDLKTDQDFADNAKAIKWCADIESRVKAAKEHTLGQTASIDAVFRAMDEISAEARNVRLELERLDKARKDAVRGEIVAGGIAALREHVAGLNTRLGKPYMPAVTADFAGAIKGKRTIDSLNDAVDTLLANTKIEASATADRIQGNLGVLQVLAAGHEFLFADEHQLVLKAPEDFRALVENRLAAHQAKEAERLQAEQARIRTEELARIEREQAEAAAQAEKAQKEAFAKSSFAPSAIETVAVPELAPVTFWDVALADEAADAAHGQDLAPAASAVVVPLAAHRPAHASAPTLKLGQIAERLGFSLTGEFLKNIGFEPAARDKSALLFHEADFPLICMRLVSHIQHVQAKQAA